MPDTRQALEAAMALHGQGRVDEAEKAYRAVLVQDENNPDAKHLLGLVASGRGDLVKAEELILEALDIEPTRPTFHFNLGVIRLSNKNVPGAREAFAKTVQLQPDHTDALFNLVIAEEQLGNVPEAERLLNQILGADPDHARAHSTMALIREKQNRFEACREHCEKALSLDPNLTEVHLPLAHALEELGQAPEARSVLEKLIAKQPHDAKAHFNLGNLLGSMGDLPRSLASFAKAIECDPHYADAHDNFLINSLYRDDVSEAELFEIHKSWGERVEHLEAPAHHHDRQPERVLKVGYVSPDFRRHSCAYFLEPLLQAHDRSQVEVYAYAQFDVPKGRKTRELERLCDHWRETTGRDDETVARQVRDDGIDVLVDLAGHTRGNRIGVFAKRPAPVQVTWLGYAATTGSSAFQARLTDRVADPEGAADACHTEPLVRMPSGFLCYLPSEEAPDVGPPPFETNGYITFGSFNFPAKISNATVRCWSQLIDKVPDSRLILKGRVFSDEAIKASYTEMFTRHGIAADRLELRPWIPLNNEAGVHPLSPYSEIDIALDTYPYNGTTTTCEALWMGVPVLTRRGERHAGRVGASLLTQTGLVELIADTEDDFVERGLALTHDKAKLAELRRSLRNQMAASPLMDKQGFAREIEAVYRNLWHQWCRR